MTATHITRPQPASEPKGTPIKAAAWRNLHFAKSGSSHLGPRTYETEQAALQRWREVVRDRSAHSFQVVDGEVLWVDYSHTIQIPVRVP